MKNNKRSNVTLVIGNVSYEQLEQEARKRALSPGDYLEMLIEMDQISNTGSDPGDTVSVSIFGKTLLPSQPENGNERTRGGHVGRDDNRTLGRDVPRETAFKGAIRRRGGSVGRRQISEREKKGWRAEARKLCSQSLVLATEETGGFISPEKA